MVAGGGGKGKGKGKSKAGREEPKKPTWTARVKSDGVNETPKDADNPAPKYSAREAPVENSGYSAPAARSAEVMTSTLSATAEAFKFEPSANEFVPGQGWGGSFASNFSSSAAEFYPSDQVTEEYDNQGWGGQQMWPGSYGGWGAQTAAAPNQGFNPLFNLDDYTDSDSEPSPRPSPRPSTTANNVSSTTNANNASAPPAATPVSRATSMPSAKEEAVHATTNNAAKLPSSPDASPKGASPKSPNNKSPKNNNRKSPLLDAAFFEDYETEDDEDERDGFVLEQAEEGESPQKAVFTSMLPDLSMSDELQREEVLHRWLDYYIDDRDSEALRSTWQRWMEASNGDCVPLVVEWLIRIGLEDCLKDRSVLEVLSNLLTQDGLSMEIVEGHLAEYSPEALEDLALDNPKARDFVKALLSLEPLETSPAVTATAKPQLNSKKENASDKACLAPANSVKSDGVSSYSRNKMLGLGIKLKQMGEIDDYTGASWSTKEASGLNLGPTPAWQRSYSQNSGGATPGGEWRDAQRKNFERLNRVDSTRNNKRAKSGGAKLMLEVSEDSWASQVKKRKDEEEINGAMPDEHFVREMRLTLNKLTIEKFDRLSDHLIDLIAQSTRPNRGIPVLMQMVFEKATTQHHFIDMYTNLCVKLHKWLTANEQIITSESQSNFKRILLNQCQNSFEQYLEPPEGFEGLSGDELYEAQVKYKTKMLGNIKLVGELLRHGMLAPKIALSVAADLSKDDPIVRDERLETLAVFLETVGPSLDDTSWTHHAQFDGIFKQVEEICKPHSRNPPLPRIRCLLKDVLDLRRDRWRNTKKAKVKHSEGPLTIDEVHQQAKLEAQKELSRGKELKGNKASDGNRRSRGDDSGRGRGPPSSPAFQQWRERDDSDSRYTSANSTPSASSTPWRVKEDSRRSKGTTDSPVAAASREIDAAKKRELLVKFHKEAAACVKEICQTIKGGGTPDINTVVQRIRACSLPQEHFCDESINLLARIVDEPRKEQRHQLFVFLKSLYAEKVFQPLELLNQAVSNFLKDAFRDPLSIDPPDLREIALQELLPTLGVKTSSLSLPRELADAPYR